jgi:hypothetical protein
MSPASAAEPTVFSAETNPLPGPCFQVSYCCLHSAATAELVAAGLVAAGLVAAGLLVGIADGALLVHAVSPAAMAPAARNARLHSESPFPSETRE